MRKATAHGNGNHGPPARCLRCVAVLVLAALVSVTFAQGFSLSWHSFNSGGEPGSCAGYSVVGSAAQAVQGEGSGSGYAGYWGFWYGLQPEEVREVDVGVKAITSPPSYVEVNTEIAPVAVLKNYSETGIAALTVFFKLRKPTGEWVHECEQPVTGLAPLGEEEVEFAAYNVGTDEGNWRAYCSTYAAGDPNPENDVWVKTFRVSSVPTWPYDWHEVEPMPHPAGGRPVKDGAWLVPGEGPTGEDKVFFAAKGNKTTDFYCYEPLGDTFRVLDSIPSDEAGKRKPPSKGCAAVYADGYVYMTKGNNTLGFWCYDVAGDSWFGLPDVPLGPGNKKVKGGTDLVYAKKQHDTGYVYLLKGYKTEFYRFNVKANRWDILPDVPYGGGRPKYDKGSFLVYHKKGQTVSEIYCHQAKYYDKATGFHHMFRYDVLTGRWTDTLKGMPLAGWHGGKPGKNKKSKDGAAGAWYDDNIYALKGGNTQQFFRYFPVGDSWQELDTLPAYGSTMKKKYVKQGGDLAGYDGGVFFALKGNKTFEVWRYKLEPEFGRPARTGVMAGNVEVRESKFELFPNPVASGFAILRLSLPKAGPVAVAVFDIAGRAVLRQSTIGGRQSTMSLDLRKAPAGVYLVRLDVGGYSRSQKLIVQK